ncbi:MAG: helix-turn-helix domain-containing protein [Halofilum sp. (in: g-proteobacteria)]|nr:helix-turn-helix domain-containing protein [Halofilum sp. (in: g-proteobacteria)]
MRSVQRHGDCRQCWLSSLCFPATLDRGEVEQLATLVQPDPPMDRGSTLFRAGDAFDRVYVVRTGCVRTMFHDSNGHDQVIGFHLPGNVIGFDTDPDSRRCCTATVLERTSVCAMDFGDLERASEEIPGLQRQLNRLLRREIAAGEDHVRMMGRNSAHARVAYFLYRWSERMAVVGRAPTSLTLPMRREDIASYLGLVTETTSRAFTRLHEDGVIAVESRRVEILDPERLREVAAG